MHKTTDNKAAVADAIAAARPKLLAVVSRYVTGADAEDVLQIAAIRAMEKAASIRDMTRLMPWLTQLHRNVAKDWIRKLASERRILDALQTNVPEEETSASCQCVVTQAKRLAPPYSSILSMVDQAGLSVGDAAKSLGLSTNNASVRLYRARRALKRELFAHCGVVRVEDCTTCRCTFDGCCLA